MSRGRSVSERKKIPEELTGYGVARAITGVVVFSERNKEEAEGERRSERRDYLSPAYLFCHGKQQSWGNNLAASVANIEQK